MIEERVGDSIYTPPLFHLDRARRRDAELTGPFPAAGERHPEPSNSASSVPYLHMFWFSSASVTEPICYEQLIIL